MELPAEAMSDILSYDSEASTVGLGHDRFADCADAASWLEGLDRQVKAIERALRHRAFFFRDFADQEGLTLIAMPPIHDGGNVDVNDVSVFKLVVIGDAVTDHIIDARAAALGIVLIAQGCGFMPMIDRPLMDELVDGPGRHPRLYLRPKEIH